jgi:hypothetical protein
VPGSRTITMSADGQTKYLIETKDSPLPSPLQLGQSQVTGSRPSGERSKGMPRQPSIGQHQSEVVFYNYEKVWNRRSCAYSRTHPSRKSLPKLSERSMTFDIGIASAAWKDRSWLEGRSRRVHAPVFLISSVSATCPPSSKHYSLGSPASLPPPCQRKAHRMTWLLRWPEIFLAVLVAAFEAYRFGSASTPSVVHATWTPQRKLEMRCVIGAPYLTAS